MKIFALFLMILQILFLSSCAKNASNADLTGAKALMQTKKIYFESEPNLLIVFTYLNPVLTSNFNEPNKSPDKELFLMSVSPKEAFLEDLSISVENQKPILRALDKDDALLKYAIKNDFAKEFSLESPLQNKESLDLQVCLGSICQQLSFQKYSKSLYFRSINLDTQYN